MAEISACYTTFLRICVNTSVFYSCMFYYYSFEELGFMIKMLLVPIYSFFYWTNCEIVELNYILKAKSTPNIIYLIGSTKT